MRFRSLTPLFKRKYSVISKNSIAVLNFPLSNFNVDFLCNKDNVQCIQENIQKRKGVGDILKVQEIYENIRSDKFNNEKLRNEFLNEINKIPNDTHPDVFNMGDEPKIVKPCLNKPQFSHEPLDFTTIAKKLNLLRTEHLGNLTGHRSYVLLGELAELEQALIKFTVANLCKRGFVLLSVPDILPSQIIEKCGMNTKGERNQVYALDEKHGENLCLSGTSEMAIAGFLMNKTFPEDQLPLKLAAVSRCYRAETSNIHEERGIYRVHQFTKVEMFGVTRENESNQFLEEFRLIEEDNFTALDIPYRVLDMPPHELGAPAYRKYDIEAWYPGRKMFGEISSCSNCTDYQSRRLNIKYENKQGETHFVHTLNGTACAIPRMLIGLIEVNQQSNGTIKIPKILQPFMDSKEIISKNKKIPQLKLIK
ncbi:serine--tRNA ligase, mitochondrial [Chrysoperla carnea]|uniref:serine--tRNA ligase, mitochondrial n=1 Tax=Chrysoperla carnea TaxID=189513 RepID=UPI001D072797|nr:serine--tRNA ligase, mitochondrial [Chrysoperla carnea]